MKEQQPSAAARLHTQIENLTRMAKIGNAFLGAMVLLVYAVVTLLLVWLVVSLSAAILSIIGV